MTIPNPFDLQPTDAKVCVVVTIHYAEHPNGWDNRALWIEVTVYQSNQSHHQYARVSLEHLKHIRETEEALIPCTVSSVRLQSYNGNEWKYIKGEHIVRLTT